MIRNYFIELFQYNDWANEQIYNALNAAGKYPDRCILLLSHIIASQDVWYERIAGNHDWNIQIWDVYNLQECSLLSKQSTQQWLKLIRNTKEKDFNRLVKYKNSKGKKFETPVRDIMAHLVNHSTYHRGQINQLLTQNGVKIPSMDFIFSILQMVLSQI